MYVLTASQTKNAEQDSIRQGLSSYRLMENAGSAAARVIKENYDVSQKRVSVICGHGNNGGDGFVVARKLKEAGAKVTILIVMGPPVTADANQMLQRAKEQQITVLNYFDNTNFCKDVIDESNIIIDAIFGIGFHGVLDHDIAEVVSHINSLKAVVISLDIPSGVHCDSGKVLKTAVKADMTVSFIAYKPCHFLFPSADFCGVVRAVSIGVDNSLISSCFAEVTDAQNTLDLIPPIPKNAHKGTKGTALLIAGSFGMAGAAVFSARAAYRSGAGLVMVCAPESIYSVLSQAVPEAVFEFSDNVSKEKTDAFLKKADSVLIGPGIGLEENAGKLVKNILLSVKVPVIVDADAITYLSRNPEILKQVNAPVIITPHAGEMARLCGISVESIINNPIKTAQQFSDEYGVITVLKGAYTCIAVPFDTPVINTSGNQGMATAGSGDMLCGIIAAFLANGMQPDKAAAAAVWVHGAAGDITAKRLGVRGMITSDMIEALPYVFK